jgi:excisionase family DNA binding protein
VAEVLTIEEAAELLHVSDPFLTGLITAGELRPRGPCGGILREDVLSYKRRVDAARHKALDELTAEAQRFDMGY